MPRWQPDARQRLEKAALDLYSDRGFDKTTVDDIAARAGLSKRTFFRHFADKREALFGRLGSIEGVMVAAVRASPATAGPLEAVTDGLLALAAAIDEEGESAARRIHIVRNSPELWERQLIKFALMAEAVAEALRSRGVGDPAAILAAESGITALRVAADRWISDPTKKSLQRCVSEALAELRSLAASSEGSFPTGHA